MAIPALSDIVKDAVSAFAAGGGGAAPTFLQGRWHQNDFHNALTANLDPFQFVAVSAGTITTAPAIADALHPGALFCRSSTTANGGVRVVTGQPLISAQGLMFRACVNSLTSFVGRTLYIGFHDSATVAQPVDGAYLKVVAGVATAESAANSVRTTATTTLTMTLSTWYTIDIEFLTATSVRFVIFDDAGAKLYDQTISTNIPSGIARAFFCGAVWTESSTTASDMGLLDYMGFGPARPNFIVTPV